jgi:alkylhydroperoxidase family enzyme
MLTNTIRGVGAMERKGLPSGAPHRTEPLNILLYLAHNPHLLEPFLPYATAIANGGSLDRRDAELLALRAGFNCRSEFEWAHHVVYARAFGLDDESIMRVPEGPAAPGWTPQQVVLLRAADELHGTSTVSDETWAELAERFDPAQLVELVMTVGQYTMLSMVANALGVATEPGLSPLPS